MICANGYAENCLLRVLHLSDMTKRPSQTVFLSIRTNEKLSSRPSGEPKGHQSTTIRTWFSSASTAGRGITVRRIAENKLGEATTRVDRRHKKNRQKSLGTSLCWNLPRKMNQRSRLDTKRPMKTLLTTSRSRPTATTRNTRLSNNRMAARRANRWTHRPATNR